jgi:hypothetical protein
MHAEVTSSPEGPVFFWNVDAPVGRGGVNRWDDVLFVSWCIYKFVRLPQMPADLRQVLDKAGLSEHCTGKNDDPLVVAITAIQEHFHRRPVDGRVSPAKGLTYTHHHDQQAYLIFRLNSVLRVAHPDKYPRIDLMPEFAWQLKKVVTPAFI